MSYWAGYGGQGLALDPSEFFGFLDNYAKNCKDKKTLKMIRLLKKAEIDVSEVTFLSSSGKEFSFFCADEGCCEGFRLVPYRMGGKKNDKWDANESIPSNDVYVLDPDIPIDGMDCFDKKAYDSYEEFVMEFKDKVGACLPAGFNWDAHIGVYSYACYA